MKAIAPRFLLHERAKREVYLQKNPRETGIFVLFFFPTPSDKALREVRRNFLSSLCAEPSRRRSRRDGENNIRKIRRDVLNGIHRGCHRKSRPSQYRDGIIMRM